MKHATSRILFAYWDALRGERAAPERADLRPAAMRHILADTFILDAAAPEPAFRLAGTRCSALFCRDLKGTAFAAAWPAGQARREADALVRTVADETVGLVAGLVGVNENGSEVPLELLLLPLRHRGRTDARLVGSLSPGTLPSWAGLVPIRTLRTGTLRTVLGARPDPDPVGEGTEVAGRRSLFVVHQGGRAANAPPSP